MTQKIEWLPEDLTRVALDSRGRDHVREQLAIETALCSALRRIFDREEGDVFTYLPRGTPADTIYAFAIGGIITANCDPAGRMKLPDGSTMTQLATLDRARAARIVAALQSDPRACCIVDEVQAAPPDSHIDDLGTAFLLKDEVYHLLTASHGAHIVEEVVGRGDVIWHGVSAICLPQRRFQRAELADARTLLEVVASVREIIVGAYDREGFVVWRRRS